MGKALWWIIGVVAVVLIVFAVKEYRSTDVATNSSPTPVSATASGSPKATATATAEPATTAGIGVAGNATYTSLVAQYKDNRIQFDMLCQAIPKLATYKTGTKVMFDNRSGDARVITINGIKYNFPGYGYRVITLSSTTLPKTFFIDCGAGQHVGTVTIQK